MEEMEKNRRTLKQVAPGDKVEAYLMPDGITWHHAVCFILSLSNGTAVLKTFCGERYIEYDISSFEGTDIKCFELNSQYIKDNNK